MVAIRELFVAGAGGHAVAVMDAAVAAGFDVLGFVSAEGPELLCDLPVLSTAQDTDGAALALGIGSNFTRERVFKEIRTLLPNAHFPPIIHPTAYVSPLAAIGEATVVLSMANVGPQCQLGQGVLVNTGASLDHDSVMKEWASLGPGSHTGGNVSIGSRTVIGLQAGILHGVSVGSDSVVGAHSFVRQNLGSGLVAYGVPAKSVRSRKTDDPYY